MVADVVDVIRAAADAKGRLQLWQKVFNEMEARTVCEVGVFKGAFAAHILQNCPHIETYLLIDPWRKLPDWRKPFNKDDADFEAVYKEAMARTEAFSSKRKVLRDVTILASKSITDGSLDAVYIDGDHTLRGITIDLISMLPKVRLGGIIAGDDFTKNIWQHGIDFSPTEVFPYAVYFAEAMQLPIVSLPKEQFAIVNDPTRGFEFIDLAGYSKLDPVNVYAMPGSWERAGRALSRKLPKGLQAHLRSFRRRLR